MDRFLSNTVNKVDKKGRVSIPASFRPCLGASSRLFTLISVDNPCVDAGTETLLNHREKHLETLNPFSEEYEFCSFVLHSESSELKVDGEGRIALSDQIREHTGIDNQVAFVGRGNFFQMWEPGRFQAYRKRAREEFSAMRAKGFFNEGARTRNAGVDNRGGRDG